MDRQGTRRQIHIGIGPVLESEELETWIDRVQVDKFILVLDQC